MMKTTYRIPRRYLFVAGTFILSLFLYIDRACISAAKEEVSFDLGLTDNQMGWVLSAFALGYALFQVPGGIFADRYGPRRVLSLIIGLWSVFTALTGMVKSYLGMLIVRFFFGASEAGAFPGMSRAVYSWIPLKERGIVQGINFSGSRIGAAFAMPLVAWMIKATGWRNSFIILGAAGVAFAIVWFVFFKDDPEKHPGIPEEEKEFILKNRQQKSENQSRLSAKMLFGSRNVWLSMIQYFGSNFTFFFCLTWLFPHLQEKFDLDLMQAGFYTMAPLIFGAAGNWFSGALVDRIYRTGKWRLSRKIPAIIGFGLVMAGMTGSLFMNSVEGAVAMLSIAVFGADMTLSPSWSFCIDIGKEHSGAVSGTMNMAGNVGSFITALAFPYLLGWTGSESAFFLVAAALAMISILAWLRMDPERPLFADKEVINRLTI